MIKRLQKFSVIIGLLFSLVLLFAAVPEAHAQLDPSVDIGLQEAEQIGLGTANLTTTIVQFVRAVIGFLGIVAVLVVLYGGYLYMTARGNPEKIVKAKRVLIQATVGTVIALLSFAIVSFVINTVLTVSQPGEGVIPPLPPSGGGIPPAFQNCDQLDPDPASPAPYICGLAPEEAQSDTTITIIGRKFGIYDAAISSVVFEKDGITYSATITTCGVAGQPSWTSSRIRVIVPIDLPYDQAGLNTFNVIVTTPDGSSSEKVVSSGLTGDSNDFTLLEGISTSPDITCIQPENELAGTPVSVEGRRFGDTQDLSTLEFADTVAATVTNWTDTELQSTIPDGSQTGYVFVTTIDGQNNGYWYTIQQPAAGLGETCNTSADPNSCVPGTCAPGLECNATLGCTCQFPSDAGLPTAGQSCDGNLDTPQCEPGVCATGNYCEVDSCTCAEFPEITDLAPDNGAPGNLVTIVGKGFGTSGTVIFMGSAPGNGVWDAGEFWSDIDLDGSYTAGEPFLDLGADAVTAALPSGCGDAALWADNQAIVEIPAGAVDGPIALVNDDFYFDTTEVGVLGAFSTSFDVNDTVRPGLCSIDPIEGSFGEAVTITGKNFGTAPGSVQIGGVEMSNRANWIWGDAVVSNATIPNLTPSSLDVQVVASGEFSNPLGFTVVASETAPNITSISPDTGPVGQYVTIAGSNFGTVPGLVRFENEADPDPYGWHLADVDFPAACGDDYWFNDSITVKVPETLQGTSLATVNMVVEKPFAGSPQGQLSNTVEFGYCEAGTPGCDLTPGICKIEPNQAPIGTKGVTIFGERLGDFLSGTSAVTFWENIPVIDLDTAVWSDSQIGSGAFGFGAMTVPNGAVSGPVTATVDTGATSNQLLFEVTSCLDQPDPDNYCASRNPSSVCCVADGICQPADECGVAVATQCTYEWDFITGDDLAGAGIPQVVQDRQCTENLQSPSPWKNSTDGCANAAIVARFTNEMIPTSFNNQTVIVQSCGTGDVFNAANCEAAPISVSRVESLQDNFAVKLTPSNNLDPQTWYQVTLRSGSAGIKNIDGVWLDGDFDSIPGGDYRWHFKTRASDQSCDLAKVLVYPQNALIETPIDVQDYEAFAVASNCNLLTGESFDWQWSIELSDRTVTDPASPVIASITRNDISGDGNIDPEQEASPISQGRVFVVAEPQQNGALNIRDDDNELIVDLKQPEIFSIYPDNHAITEDVDGYMMISGRNFGDDPSHGSVFFGEAKAQLAECSQSWSDTRLLVKVPKAEDISPETYDAYNLIAAPATLPETALAYTFEGPVSAVVVDSSGNNFTGDVKGQAFQVNGIFGKGMRFGRCTVPEFTSRTDCEGAGNEWRTGYIETQHNDLLTPVNSFTLEAWVRPHELEPQNQNLVRKGDSISYALQLLDAANNGAYEFTITTENGKFSIQSPFGAPLDMWQYVVATYDGSSISLYINGALVARQIASGNVQTQPENMFIGMALDNGVLTFPFNGQLDQVQIHDRALTHDEILERFGVTTNTRGQVALWNFDNETGIIAEDTSGNGHQGTLTNNMVRTTDAKFGGGVQFDGVNDFIRVPASPAFTFTDALSVSAWFNTTNASQNQRIISMSESGGFHISLNENGVCPANSLCFLTWLDLEDGTSGWYYASTPSSSVSSNQWHNVVGVYDGQTISLYLDGKQVGTFTPTDGVGTPLSGRLGKAQVFTPICIGEEAGAATCLTGVGTFSGKLDTIALYNRALTDAEIQKGSGVVDNSFIRVETTIGSDTSDFNDNKIKDPGETFRFSDIVYPFLCSLEPDFGGDGTEIALSGFNFGDSNKTFYKNSIYDIGSVVKYDGISAPADTIGSWDNENILSRASVLDDTVPQVGVRVAIAPDSDIFIDLNGNGVYDRGEPFEDRVTPTGFTLNEFDSNELALRIPPTITDISPGQGPVKQWITVTGYNFGETPGEVLFFGETPGILPSVCSSAWTNTQIIIEIPDGVNPGDAGDITVITAGALVSNPWPFTITDETPGPGLCSITPEKAAPNDAVTATGINFLDKQDQRGLGEFIFTTGFRCSLAQYADETSCTTNGGQWIGGEEAGTEPDGAWTNTTIDSNVPVFGVTGNVFVKKREEIGRRCVGFSIGNFCPSGDFEIDFEELVSNPVLLTIPTEEGTDGACTTNDDCLACGAGTSQCVNGICQPYIESIQPDTGGVSDWVNIQGCYFGCQPGQIVFNGYAKVTGCLNPFFDTQEECESPKGEWIPASCANPIYATRADCENNEETWLSAFCTDGSLTTQAECEAPRSTWLGLCSNPAFITQAECEAPRGIWTRAFCDDPLLDNQVDCELNGQVWTPDACQGDPTAITQAECESSKGSWGVQGFDTSTTGFFAPGIVPDAQICGETWACADSAGGRDQVTIEVPNIQTATTDDDALTGQLKLITAFGREAISQNDFIVNSQPSGLPQLCNMIPRSGPVGTVVDIRGKNFGETITTAVETDRVIFHSALTDEPFLDDGLDRIPDEQEPGYDPNTNPDPAGDNYNSVTNPTGTEGNGAHDIADVGIDGLASIDEPGYEPATNPDPSGDNWNATTNPRGTEGDGVFEEEFFTDVNANGVQDSIVPYNTDVVSYISQAELATCPADDGWSENQICGLVPEGVVDSNVDIHKNVEGVFKEGTTKRRFNVIQTYAPTDGPSVIWSNPDNGSADFCINGMPFVAFDRVIQTPNGDFGADGIPNTREPGYNANTNPDPAGDNYDPVKNPNGTEGDGTIEKRILLESCGTLAYGDNGIFSRFAQLMKTIAFGMLNIPQISNAADCDTATRTEVPAQFSTFTNELGNSFIFIEPNQNLDPSFDYRLRVKGGADGVKDLFGNQLFNQNDGDDYVIDFSTGSVLCEVDYIDTTVYNRPYSGADPFVGAGNGIVRTEDLFTCTRPEGCVGQFDFDQDLLTIGNQHIYNAIGYAAGGFVCIDRSQTPDAVVSNVSEAECINGGYDWIEKTQSNAISATYQWEKPEGSDAVGLITQLYSFACTDGGGNTIFVGSQTACEAAGGTWAVNDINCNIPQYTSQAQCVNNGGTWFGDEPFQVRNADGVVFVTPNELVEQGVAQLTVSAQARGSNRAPVQQPFTVHMLQCNNPWPSYDNLFPPEPITNVYNIQTYYCRDGEDPLDPSDDLPAAQYFVPDIQNLSILTNTDFEKGTLENWIVSNGGAFTSQPTTGGVCVDGTFHDNMYCRTSGAFSAGAEGNWFASSYDYYQGKTGQTLGGFRDDIGTETGWLTSKQFVIEGDILQFRMGASTTNNVGVRVFVDDNANGVFDGIDEQICNITPSTTFVTKDYTCDVSAHKGSDFSDDNGNGIWDFGEFCFSALVNNKCPGPEKAVVQVYDENDTIGKYIYFDRLQQILSGVEVPIRF